MTIENRKSKIDNSKTSSLFEVRLFREDLNFSAGHISTYQGESEGQHGHNYRLAISFQGELNEDALVIDFRTVKRILKKLLQRWNHRTLVPLLNPHLTLERGQESTRIEAMGKWLEMPNETLVFLELPNITSEMLARHIHAVLAERLPKQDRRRLTKVTVEVIESPGQSATYSAPV